MPGCDRLERRASANAMSDTARLALAMTNRNPEEGVPVSALTLSQVTIWMRSLPSNRRRSGIGWLRPV